MPAELINLECYQCCSHFYSYRKAHFYFYLVGYRIMFCYRKFSNDFPEKLIFITRNESCSWWNISGIIQNTIYDNNSLINNLNYQLNTMFYSRLFNLKLYSVFESKKEQITVRQNHFGTLRTMEISEHLISNEFIWILTMLEG